MKSCEMWNKSEIILGCAEKKLLPLLYHYNLDRNVPKFLDRQIWANSADPEQSDQGLHCLQFPLHLLDALL